jgi:hypothetical protein
MEFGKLTPAEYLAMVTGFIEYRHNEIKTQRILAMHQAWNTAYLVSFSYNAPDKMPKLETLLQTIKD